MGKVVDPGFALVLDAFWGFFTKHILYAKIKSMLLMTIIVVVVEGAEVVVVTRRLVLCLTLGLISTSVQHI